MYKYCKQCKLDLKYSFFYKNKGHSDGIDTIRKSCSKTQHKNSYQNNIEIEKPKRKERNKMNRYKNPNYIKNHHLKDRYGITLEQKNDILTRQNYKCAICKIDISSRACVNHDHTTGVIRELLCDQCNTAIGAFKEKVDNLANAIKYLDKWKQ